MTEDVLRKIGRKEEIVKNCPYGTEYFCNGEPNSPPHPGKDKPKKRERCIYYRGGMCKNGRVSISGK